MADEMHSVIIHLTGTTLTLKLTTVARDALISEWRSEAPGQQPYQVPETDVRVRLSAISAIEHSVQRPVAPAATGPARQTPKMRR